MVAGMPCPSWWCGLNLFEVKCRLFYQSTPALTRLTAERKPVYLECLTSMASYALYTSTQTFFPEVPVRAASHGNKLKYGLLGSAIEIAPTPWKWQIRKNLHRALVIGYNLHAKKPHRTTFAVGGQEKYQRSREPKTLVQMELHQIVFSKESEMVLSFGEPWMLGNRVDTEGNSLDKITYEVNLRGVLPPGRELSENAQRESVYTCILADRVLDSYFQKQRGLVEPSRGLRSVSYAAQPPQRPWHFCHPAPQSNGIFPSLTLILPHR